MDIQQQRCNDFAQYVTNQARAQAFKMAMMGYKAFKDDDPDEAQKYKETMENIIRSNTAADQDDDSNDEEMPSLSVNRTPV